MTEQEYITATNREIYLCADRLLSSVVILEEGPWLDEHVEIRRRLRALEGNLHAQLEVTSDEV